LKTWLVMGIPFSTEEVIGNMPSEVQPSVGYIAAPKFGLILLFLLTGRCALNL
jgi:hypothetical protein